MKIRWYYKVTIPRQSRGL